jgi:hypothetical protein
MTKFYLSFHPMTKIQNEHHLLNFYLSASCKSLNNSQLYRFLLLDPDECSGEQEVEQVEPLLLENGENNAGLAGEQ